MRYDEFRDRWHAALRTVRLLAHHDRPEETIDLTTTERRWRVRPLSQPVDPFHAGATISFRWDPFDSARSYTCEEDLLTELVGRRSRRSTQRRLVRVDVSFRATLPYGSTIAMPAPDIWAPWVASAEKTLDTALVGKRPRKRTDSAWRGDLEINGHSLPNGLFAFHTMSLPAFEMIAVPRIWDDPKRREREKTADKPIHALAGRVRAALDAWVGSVGELARWLRHAPVRSRRGRRNPLPRDEDSGPETMH
jgi:hypothetical protein